MRDYFIISFKLDAEKYYCIWYTNDFDGVIVDENGCIEQFASESELHEYCAKNDIALSPSEENNALYDLDTLNKWLKEDKVDIDCSFMLNMWNIISDVARSINKSFVGDDDKMLTIYNKLFYGNNLPVYSPTDKEYIPIWDSDEIDALRLILSNGIEAIIRPAINLKS